MPRAALPVTPTSARELVVEYHARLLLAVRACVTLSAPLDAPGRGGLVALTSSCLRTQNLSWEHFPVAKCVRNSESKGKLYFNEVQYTYAWSIYLIAIKKMY